MATALALTPNTANASVLLQITGAPSSTPVYTQGTGVDSWVGQNGATLTSGLAYTGAVGFKIERSATSGDVWATRTISGLTIGTKYRMRAWVKSGASTTTMRIGIDVIGFTAFSSTTTSWQAIDYTFTATATSHSFWVLLRPMIPYVIASAYVDDITVVPYTVSSTTTITRTDANGSRPVRVLDGQEPIAGVMTVTDYEAALTGTVRYDVVDTAGVTTSASTTLAGVAVPWLRAAVLPQLGGALEYVTDYRSARASLSTVHRPVGRVAPLVVTGKLGSREGSLTMWCSSYPNALTVASAATNGDVLLLRQPTYAGMDMYFVAQSLNVNPGDAATARRWSVGIDYIEVDVPADALAGAAGWTYASVAGGYATYAAAKSAFTDYADLVAGP